MSSAAVPATPAAEPSARALFFTVFPSIMLPMFLAALDQTIVATALPAIAGSSAMSSGCLGWSCPTWSRPPSPRRSTAGLATCWAAGACCSRRWRSFSRHRWPARWRPACWLLTAARVLQGLGGGGLMTTCQALVGEVVPPRERGRYQGYLASIFVASSTFGPVAGGWLTQHSAGRRFSW